jgi:hypothetical protein
VKAITDSMSLWPETVQELSVSLRPEHGVDPNALHTFAAAANISNKKQRAVVKKLFFQLGVWALG